MTVGRAVYLKILCLSQSALEIQKQTPSSSEPPCSPLPYTVESRDRHTKANMWTSYSPASSAPVSSCETTSHEPLGTSLQIRWISYRRPGKSWPAWWSVWATGAGLQPQQPGRLAWGDSCWAGCAWARQLGYPPLHVWEPSLPTTQRAKLGDL